MMKNKTLFYIELPPPMHGMTYINRIIYNGLKDNENYIFHNVNYSQDILIVKKRSFNKIWQNIQIILRAWKFFFLHKPTQVYSVITATKFGIMRDFLLLLPSMILRKKRVLHMHGFTYFDIYQNSKLYKFFFEVLTRNSKLIVLCNKHKELTKVIFNKNSFVLSNTLEEDIMTKPKSISNKNIKLLYISNIGQGKGIFDLLESIKDIENVTLTIAGGFLDNEDKFRILIKTMKNQVNFVGFANEEEKKKLLLNHDVFCIPSKLSEGSPVSIIEAMACGLPIIGTDKGCITEMIEECGYVVNDGLDKIKMKESLSEIITNYSLYSTNAIKNYKMFYTKEVFLNTLDKIIDIKEHSNK